MSLNDTDSQARGDETRRLYPGAVDKPLRNGFRGLLWGPVTAMPSLARQHWRERAIPVATAAFDGTSVDYWGHHWADEELDKLSVLHVAVDDAGNPAGWVSGRRTTWGGRRVLYAASAGVAPDVQGGGLSAALWRRVVERELLRAALRPLFVVTRTGNPLVYDAWTAAAGDRRAVHPRPGTPVPAALQVMAREGANYLGQATDFDPSTLCISDAYRSTPAGLWRHRPRSRDERTNLWFDTALQPTDAFLVVIRFHPLAQAWRSLTRRRR
ncbi:MAG TPA: GNAT family N-acetyltransferase [Kineosporiaceae bacterium]|nr:GNAT family N-acetyltransferase [Kineosporiaceae bacterium]